MTANTTGTEKQKTAVLLSGSSLYGQLKEQQVQQQRQQTQSSNIYARRTGVGELVMVNKPYTCGIWDKHHSDQEAQQASPADSPELGSVADVVEEDGGGQGSKLAHSCGHAVGGGPYT